jgi:hypothetical protein
MLKTMLQPPFYSHNDCRRACTSGYLANKELRARAEYSDYSLVGNLTSAANQLACNLQIGAAVQNLNLGERVDGAVLVFVEGVGWD